MFEAEIKQILDEKKDQLTTEVIKSLKDRIRDSIVWKAEETLNVEVQKFVTEEIIPEVRKELLENKEAITKLFVDMAKNVAVDISLAMSKKVSTGLADSWKVKKIIETLI